MVAVTLLAVGATVSNRKGMYQAFLQSNLDGNQQTITNLNALTVNQLLVPTNAVSLWPAQAPFPGAAVLVNSNSVIYLITSTPGSTAWGSTNKIAP